MSNYSCDGRLFKPWDYSICAKAHTACDCVCGLIHITHPHPPPHCWAATTSPRDTIRSPGRKAGPSGWTLRRDRLAGQVPFPPRLWRLPWQDADGPRCRGEAKVQSVSTQLADCGDLKQSRCEASLLALHWAMRARTEGNRKAWSGWRFAAVTVVCLQSCWTHGTWQLSIFSTVGQLLWKVSGCDFRAWSIITNRCFFLISCVLTGCSFYPKVSGRST